MAADPGTLNITCPHCAARYLLPAHLLGPGGARVRCPGCSRSFDVAPPPASAAPVQALAHAAHGVGDSRHFAVAEAEADIESDVRERGAGSGFAVGEDAAAMAGGGPAPEAAPPDAGADRWAEADSDAAPESATSDPWAMAPESAAEALLPAHAQSASESARFAESAQAPEAVAREVLEAVARRAGADLAAAAAAGYLFAHYGPQIFAAFDEYRKRAGDAGSAPFRAALRGLWGIDLPEVIRRR